jgi:hypothetical protein
MRRCCATCCSTLPEACEQETRYVCRSKSREGVRAVGGDQRSGLSVIEQERIWNLLYRVAGIAVQPDAAVLSGR